MGWQRSTSVLWVLLILAAPPVMLYTLWSNPLSAGEDDVVYYYPLRKLVGQGLGEGLWRGTNALEAGGGALMSDPLSSWLFPPTWLFALLEAQWAYTLSIFAAFWVAGAGAWAYLRKLGLAGAAAAFGAIVFTFCGYMVGHRVHLGNIQAAAFLPWGLWCIETARTHPRRAFAAATPILLLALAAGHWPTFIHMGLIWAAYFLFRGRPLLRSALVLGLAGVLALAIAAPQVVATWELLRQTTRQEIGYATAGENSFFPAAAIMALFPMIFGSRTPNFFPQRWWGPWHLCEMLGYVGLVTLVLAGAAVWVLFRKRSRGKHSAGLDSEQRRLGGLVRTWTWITIGGMVWMLGYYLPTYRLVHALPVLGVVRCPARMVLAVDMGLATLAAIAVHVLIIRPAGGAIAGRLARGARRAATVVMPAAMAASLLLLAAVAWALRGIWRPNYPIPMGGAEDALRAVAATNPAVWVPLALIAVTAVTVWLWLRAPRRLVAALIVLLLADLFLITRFVDVPADYARAPALGASPAADWLSANAPKDRPFRVYGLSKDYHHRPPELLLPKTCAVMGVATIGNYGPFQSPAHVHLFGFRPWGYTRQWPDLIRRNFLLSLYNVRYVIAEAGGEHERVLRSVRIADSSPPAEGPELLANRWALNRAEQEDGTLRLSAAFMWRRSMATQDVSGRLRAETVYRISLDARGPDGGGANYLQADIGRRRPNGTSLPGRPDGGWSAPAGRGLVAEGPQIGTAWRHFEWTFQTARDLSGQLTFRVFTLSERVIEVRNVSLRASDWPRPVNLTGLAPGRSVYCKVVELRALTAGDPNVVIYENRLCRPAATSAAAGAPSEIERLKWRPPPDGDWRRVVVPDLALRVDRPAAWSAGAAAAALAVYLSVLVGSCVVARRQRRRKVRQAPNLDGGQGVLL